MIKALCYDIGNNIKVKSAVVKKQVKMCDNRKIFKKPIYRNHERTTPELANNYKI